MIRFALNTSTIRPTPLLEKIQIAAECGYQGIELWHTELDDYVNSGGSLPDLRRRLHDLGLEVPTTINVKGWFDSASPQDPAWLECRRRMEQAVIVGAPYVIAGPPQQSTDWNRGIQNYQRLLALGHQLGVLPAMEFLGFVEQVSTLEAAREIIAHAQDAAARLVLDPFHIVRGGGTFSTIADLQPSDIAVCHINDVPAHIPATQLTDADRVLPGDGILDLRGLLHTLKQLGYQGFVSLELFSSALWERDPRDVARLGLERMQQLLS